MEDSGNYTSDQFDATGQSKLPLSEPEPVNEEEDAPLNQDEVYEDEEVSKEEEEANPGEAAQNNDLMMMVNDIGDVQSTL